MLFINDSTVEFLSVSKSEGDKFATAKVVTYSPYTDNKGKEVNGVMFWFPRVSDAVYEAIKDLPEGTSLKVNGNIQTVYDKEKNANYMNMYISSVEALEKRRPWSAIHFNVTGKAYANTTLDVTGKVGTARLSTFRTIKDEDGEVKLDAEGKAVRAYSNWFAKVCGEKACAALAEMETGDLIEIKSGSFTNSYDKENKQSYYSVNVFEAEKLSKNADIDAAEAKEVDTPLEKENSSKRGKSNGKHKK